MNFKRKFNGYDTAEVDKYIEESEARDKQIRTAQKERIDELTEENYTLRQQLHQYQTDEQAISKSLIVSQRLAEDLKFDAEKYSDLVLSRAKIFYATWRSYAQTLISSLSPQEIAEFNKLQRKIEDVINAYEGKDVAKEIKEREEKKTASGSAATEHASRSLDKKQQQQARATIDVTPTKTTMGTLANPISKIEQAADQVIDLRELTRTDLSLEELCAELGLTVRKDK